MSVALVENGAALLSMRSSDFDAYSAYGEVIDNSIQANAENIKIRMDYSPSTLVMRREPISRISFGDDGYGMESEILHRCLQLGYSSRYNDRSGIGRFGVGATLAAINQCQKVEIYSKQKNKPCLYTFVDLELITSTPPEMTNIPEPIEKDIPEDLTKLVGLNQGTLVVWSKYDRQPTDASEMLDEFRAWAGRTFRKFIWKGISITLNGSEVKAIDPLYVTTEKTRFPDDEPAYEYQAMEIAWPVSAEDRKVSSVDKSTITIRTSLLPEFLRPRQGAGNTNAVIERSIHLNDGISIVRNDREVFYGRIPYWPGKPFQEIDRWWGCEISFDAVLDREFTVKNIKRGAVPVKELKKLLADKIEPTRGTALERVREVWSKAKTVSKTTKKESTVDTGHGDAERVAKNTPTPNNLLDREKDRSQEIDKFNEEWIKHADEQQKASWKAKFEGQPFTIIDNEWRGPEFFETAHLGGSSVLSYNMRHVFFDEIEDIRLALEEEDSDNVNAQRLKALIDLLLISYAKSEVMFDSDLTLTAEKFIEQLRMNWGNYLSNYIDTYAKEQDLE